MKDIGVHIKQLSGVTAKLLNHTNLRCICETKNVNTSTTSSIFVGITSCKTKRHSFFIFSSPLSNSTNQIHLNYENTLEKADTRDTVFTEAVTTQFTTNHLSKANTPCQNHLYFRTRTISISGPLSEHTGYDSGELGSGRFHPGARWTRAEGRVREKGRI